MGVSDGISLQINSIRFKIKSDGIKTLNRMDLLFFKKHERFAILENRMELIWKSHPI